MGYVLSLHKDLDEKLIKPIKELILKENKKIRSFESDKKHEDKYKYIAKVFLAEKPDDYIKLMILNTDDNSEIVSQNIMADILNEIKSMNVANSNEIFSRLYYVLILLEEKIKSGICFDLNILEMMGAKLLFNCESVKSVYQKEKEKISSLDEYIENKGCKEIITKTQPESTPIIKFHTSKFKDESGSYKERPTNETYYTTMIYYGALLCTLNDSVEYQYDISDIIHAHNHYKKEEIFVGEHLGEFIKYYQRTMKG